MKKQRTLSMAVVPTALIALTALTLTGCNHSRQDSDDDSEIDTGRFDQVGDVRVYDEKKPTRRIQKVQAAPRPEPKVARNSKPYTFDSVGETNIAE